MVLTPLDGIGWLLVVVHAARWPGATASSAIAPGGVPRSSTTGRWPWLLPVAALGRSPSRGGARRCCRSVSPRSWSCGPLMGGTLSTAPLWPRRQAAPSPHLQCRGRERRVVRLREMLDDTRPDIAGFAGVRARPCARHRRALEGWAVDRHRRSSICFLSRYPLRAPPVADAGAGLPRRRRVGRRGALRGHGAHRHGDGVRAPPGDAPPRGAAPAHRPVQRAAAHRREQPPARHRVARRAPLDRLDRRSPDRDWATSTCRSRASSGSGTGAASTMHSVPPATAGGSPSSMAGSGCASITYCWTIN